MNGTDERTGRDGRLLALVIVVSLAVLVVARAIQISGH